MVKKKKTAKKRVMKKKGIIKKNTSQNQNIKIATSKKINPVWFFVNLLLLTATLFGVYYAWEQDWIQGLSIILGVIVIKIILLIIKILRNKNGK